MRLFRRADTADCPVGLRERLGKVGRRLGAVAWAVLGSVLFLFGYAFVLWRSAELRFQGNARPLFQEPAKGDEGPTRCREIMGVPAFPPGDVAPDPE